MNGIKLGFDETQQYNYNYASFTLKEFFEYDVALNESERYTPSTPGGDDVLVYL